MARERDWTSQIESYQVAGAIWPGINSGGLKISDKGRTIYSLTRYTQPEKDMLLLLLLLNPLKLNLPDQAPPKIQAPPLK